MATWRNAYSMSGTGSLVIGPVLENLSEKGRTYGWTSEGKRHIMDDKDNSGNFRYS